MIVLNLYRLFLSLKPGLNSTILMPKWKSKSADRSSRQRGGVALYVHSSIAVDDFAVVVGMENGKI